MRHVNHVAGVPTRRTLAHFTRLQDDDLVVGAQLQQAARCRKAGKAGADDKPVCVHVAVERSNRKRTPADRLPARNAIFDRQAFDGPRDHLIVSLVD
ncbi:hypothetical protein D9M68_820410 [compost metagenome]